MATKKPVKKKPVKREEPVSKRRKSPGFRKGKGQEKTNKDIPFYHRNIYSYYHGSCSLRCS